MRLEMKEWKRCVKHWRGTQDWLNSTYKVRIIVVLDHGWIKNESFAFDHRLWIWTWRGKGIEWCTETAPKHSETLAWLWENSSICSQIVFTKQMTHQIDNEIGDEGVKVLCDALKVNTGLIQLDLQSQAHCRARSQVDREWNKCFWWQAVDLGLKEQGHWVRH